MKKHMVILCGVFYPEPSPTGLCVKRFAGMLSDQFDIDIVCISPDGITKRNVINSDNTNYRIQMVGCKRLELEYKTTGVVKRIIHSFGSVQLKIHMLGNMNWYRMNAVNVLEQLHSERKIDVIFSVCSPMAAHLAGADMKKCHPAIWHCGYTVDPYSTKNRIRPVFISFERLVSYEKKVLKDMDVVLLSDEVATNRKELLTDQTKYDILPYMLPEFRSINVNEQFFPSEGINCVYAGRFYEDIRNPKRLLDIFSKMDGSGINLHLFSVGCEDILNKYSEYNNIYIHDIVPSDCIGAVYEQADVLINVGNKTEEFFPSKTFEYISTGKPIVYISQMLKSNELLEAYKMSTQILINETLEMAADRIADFCQSNKNRRLSRENIEMIYNNHSADAIKKKLLIALKSPEERISSR